MPGKSLSFDYQIVEGEFTLKIHQEKSPAEASKSHRSKGL